MGAIIPTGTVLNFAGRNAPAGWLICDGRAISRTTYRDLFNTIGTIYGNGNGNTTFNIPDLINRFMEGGISKQVGTRHDAGLPNITGTFEIWKFNSWTGGCFYETYMGRPANTKNGGSDPAWKITMDAVNNTHSLNYNYFQAS